jgi:hypothetical protein
MVISISLLGIVLTDPQVSVYNKLPDVYGDIYIIVRNSINRSPGNCLQ